MTKQKIRFIQLEFYTEYDTPSDYMVIVEVIDDKPKGSYTVRVPLPFTLLPHYLYIRN